jgi:hypothetical protein
MQHANAPLTPQGRLRLVLLVEEEGFTLQEAADACNVAKSTCWGWVGRWRGASEPIASRLPAWKTGARGHTEAPTRCQTRRPHGSASDASTPAGARGDWPKRRISQGRTRRFIGCCVAAAAHASHGPRLLRGGPLRVAVSREPVAHGRQEARALPDARPRPHQGPHQTLPRSGLGARAAPTHPRPTARSSASTRPSCASGPTHSNTPHQAPVAKPCHAGSTTTDVAPMSRRSRCEGRCSGW